MGELHIDILLDRLLKDYKVSARVGKPQVSFREKPASFWQGEGKFDQEIQGHRHFAKISLKIEPCLKDSTISKGAGFVFDKDFIIEKKDLKISPDIKTALKEGLEQGLSSGPFNGLSLKGFKSLFA